MTQNRLSDWRALLNRHLREEEKGHLWVHEHYQSALAKLTWTTVDKIVNSQSLSVIRRIEQRDNATQTILLDSGISKRVFIKRHWETNPGFIASGVWEALMAIYCQEQGVPCMQVVAAGAKNVEPDTKTVSVFISEEVAQATQADHWHQSQAGVVNELDPDEKANLLRSMAQTAAVFHSAGLVHRDFYWCHFLIRQEAKSIDAILIDLQRSLYNPLNFWRWRIKDLAQWLVSCPRWVTSDDKQFWWDCYSRCAELRPWRSAFLWHATKLRAAFYRYKDGHE